MTVRHGWLLGAAAAFLLGLSGNSPADETFVDAAAELEHVLTLTSERPLFQLGQFGACVQPSSQARGNGSFELWCQKCVRSGPGWQTSFDFYPDPDRGGCALQQIEFRATPWTLNEAVELRLRDVWKSAPQRVPFLSEDNVWDARSDGTPLRWDSGEARAWLYWQQQREGSSPQVVVLWRQAHLVTMLRERDAEDPGDGPVPEQTTLRRACEQAGGEECATVAALVYGYDQASPPPGTAAFRSVLVRLASTKPDDPSYAAQLYWAQKLGETIANDRRYEAETHSEDGEFDVTKVTARVEALNRDFPELAPLQASFGTVDVWKEEEVAFDSTFEKSLRENYLHDRWGRQAYLEMLQGSSDSSRCETGLEPAWEVIDGANKFLARFPDTETSDAVRLALAEAWETIWSFSIAESHTEFVLEWKDARAGGPEAREEALTIYRVLAAKPGASRALNEKVTRLEQRLDTGQRAYVCTEGC